MAFTNYIQQITDTAGTTYDLVDTSASHYIKGTQTGSTNVWTGALPDGVTAYYDGLAIDYFLPFAGTSTAATLNLGSKGAKPVYRGNSPTSAVTTHFPALSVIHMTYIINSSINSGNGAWIASAYYDSNSNDVCTGYQRFAYGTYTTTTAVGRYVICLSKTTTSVVPVTAVNNSTATTKALTTDTFNPFEPIYYYTNNGSTTQTAANAALSASYLWTAYSNINLGYSFNTGSTLTTNKDVFIKATPTNGYMATLASTPIVQDLPNSDDGFIYIKLGHANSTSNIAMAYEHPVYWYKNGAVRKYAGTITGSGTSGYIAKWNGGSSITNGPQFGSDSAKYLRNDGTWAIPPGEGGMAEDLTELTGVTSVSVLETKLNEVLSTMPDSGAAKKVRGIYVDSTITTSPFATGTYEGWLFKQANVSAGGGACILWTTGLQSTQTMIVGHKSGGTWGNWNSYAKSSHTHTAALDTDTGTSSITLAHGRKYKLTAGGSSVIFTMPASGNTDTKLQVAAVTSGSTYYPIVGTGTTAATRQFDTTGFAYKGTNGTTSSVGSAIVTLGNSTASGTANNKQGQVVLYGSTAYATTVTPGAPTAARTITLPNATGTIALEGNMVALWTGSQGNGGSAITITNAMTTYSSFIFVFKPDGLYDFNVSMIIPKAYISEQTAFPYADDMGVSGTDYIVSSASKSGNNLVVSYYSGAGRLVGIYGIK